jgi:hypothetical protein
MLQNLFPLNPSEGGSVHISDINLIYDSMDTVGVPPGDRLVTADIAGQYRRDWMDVTLSADGGSCSI